MDMMTVSEINKDRVSTDFRGQLKELLLVMK